MVFSATRFAVLVLALFSAVAFAARDPADCEVRRAPAVAVLGIMHT